jgi:hypothetical protein
MSTDTLKKPSKEKMMGMISGSHGGECEDESLLAYNAMYSHCSRPTFQKCVLPPLSG